MRLWSLHPKYLDEQGLNDLWREAIIARETLEQGMDFGYYHPHLDRFKEVDFPIQCIYTYLYYVKQEADRRGYNYNGFDTEETLDYYIPVTNGQLDFEEGQLKDKLEERGSIEEHDNLTVGARFLDTHPLFYVVNGDKERYTCWRI